MGSAVQMSALPRSLGGLLPVRDDWVAGREPEPGSLCSPGGKPAYPRDYRGDEDSYLMKVASPHRDGFTGGASAHP
jgi:hypothetical protein